MVQYEFCLNFNGIRRIEPKGVKYGRPIEDSFEEINCPYYLEKGVAGLMGMNLDFLTLDGEKTNRTTI
ncbi:MAG: hypothetical protein J7L23_00635 [Candidatus Diapherotrites archaeon]|nr:hypothetical protein [Candidatus Diapherotrites archaeon]